MANTIKCGDCKKYHAIKKPIRSKTGGFKDLHRGHCLARTVYAKNKPGDHVYPPKAVVKDLPFGRHQIVIVHEDEVVPHCIHAKEKTHV